MNASHVVVDTQDGYTFAKGADGNLFTAATAAAFAAQRNAEMKPQFRSYRVFALVPADPGTPAADTAKLRELVRTIAGEQFGSDDVTDLLDLVNALAAR
jgi:hypothetical protein